MTGKISTETVSPQKSIGDNLNYTFDYVYDGNFAHRLVRAGERYYQYDENGNVICEQDGDFESNGDDFAYHKITQEAEDVYSTDYGWGLFKDEDGESGGAPATRYRRTYTWDERNQLISSVDANYSTAYVYGQDGQRSNKYTQSSETLYFNKMWTLHTDSGNSVYGGQTAKNIYLGETRIVTKLNSGSSPTYQEEYYKQYFYHFDHLGSASLISDYKGDEYQRIEYTPYGETWVEKTQNTGLEFLPYKFTAKELDKETGLYYYGARYLDPKYSRWISTDPALGEYIPEIDSDLSKLPAGGVFDFTNLNIYHYAGNNPIIYNDPNGNFKTKQFVFATFQTMGGIAEVAATCSLTVGSGGLSAGLTIYGIFDGIANIGDGIIGMVAAAKDQDYRGYVAETTTAIAKGCGMDSENAELWGDVVGLSKTVIDMDVLDMPNLAKGLNSDSKIVKGVDTLIEAGNRIAIYESGLEIAGKVIEKIKATNTETVSKPQSQKQKEFMDRYYEHH